MALIIFETALLDGRPPRPQGDATCSDLVIYIYKYILCPRLCCLPGAAAQNAPAIAGVDPPSECLQGLCESSACGPTCRACSGVRRRRSAATDAFDTHANHLCHVPQIGSAPLAMECAPSGESERSLQRACAND
eukprot:8300365-Pyramimonas_sp.AAC.1